MLAAIQKWPSGRRGSRFAAVRPAATPRSSAGRRAASASWPPSQYIARASFQALSKSRGFVRSCSSQRAAAARALAIVARSRYNASASACADSSGAEKTAM
jgi:hypothetical protein